MGAKTLRKIHWLVDASTGRRRSFSDNREHHEKSTANKRVEVKRNFFSTHRSFLFCFLLKIFIALTVDIDCSAAGADISGDCCEYLQ